jgi:hypothetical protein
VRRPIRRRAILTALTGLGAGGLLVRTPWRSWAAEAGSPPATARTPWPAIVPRTAWDADGTCVPAVAPELGPPVRHVVVHHTQIFAAYDQRDAGHLVHNLCASHVEQRGFDDLGYHLVIDRFGTVYEGRAGGLSRPVVGAHAQGFNHGTVGVALMGDFDRGAVPDAARRSLVRVVAWLCRLHGIDPTATLPHVSTGGPKSRFEEGEEIQAPALLAHRRVGLTSCPGRHLDDYVASGRLLDEVVAELAAGDAASPVADAGGSVDAAAPAPPAPAAPGGSGEPAGLAGRVASVLERLITPRTLRP